MNRGRNRTPKAKGRLAITILSVIFTLNLLIFIGRIAAQVTDSYGYDYSSIVRDAGKHDYPEMTDMLSYNETRNQKIKENTDEYDALGYYFYEAQKYKAYKSIGDEENKKAQKEILAAIEEQITDEDIKDCIQDINTRFEVD